LRADNTLSECAIQKRDDKILAVTSRDIVASEANYHRSCYQAYTRLKKEEQLDENTKGVLNEEINVNDDFQEAEREAFNDLYQHIRTDIFKCKKIVTVASMTSRLTKTMTTGGINVRDSTKKHVRRKLESEFGETIRRVPDNQGKLLFVPCTVSIDDVILENQSLHRQMKSYKGPQDDNKIISRAASIIRASLKENFHTASPWRSR